MDAKQLLDSLEHGVVAIAPDWTIAAWTATAARITGLPAERVLGQSFWVAFPAAKATHIERVLQEVLHDGKSQMYLAPAAATDFPGMVFETQVSRGPHNHVIMVFRQVREELGPESRAAHLMSALETERRLYLQLFNSLPTPALVLTVDGQIIESNPEGVKLLGAADAVALRGRPMGDWTPAAHRGPLAAALRDAVTQRQELCLTVEYAGEPPRDVRAVIVNVDPMRHSPKLLFLALDVSRESLLQQRLLQADRLSQLGALVSGVAHELNNPLAAIAAFGEALALDPHQADLAESAEVIRSEAMRAGRIVQTLLDFARQRPRMQTAVDLGEIAERVLALQRSALKKARIRTTVSVSNDVPAVAGDPQELQQVMLNAVVNARQAIETTGRPGQIAIAARRAAMAIWPGRPVVSIACRALTTALSMTCWSSCGSPATAGTSFATETVVRMRAFLSALRCSASTRSAISPRSTAVCVRGRWRAKSSSVWTIRPARIASLRITSALSSRSA